MLNNTQFLPRLLVDKPDDVFDYSRQYFSRFRPAAEDLPEPVAAETAEESVADETNDEETPAPESNAASGPQSDADAE